MTEVEELTLVSYAYVCIDQGDPIPVDVWMKLVAQGYDMSEIVKQKSKELIDGD